MSDQDCTKCVYGPDFVDDGVWHRLITTMCEPCKAEAGQVLKFLIDAKAAGQRQGDPSEKKQ